MLTAVLNKEKRKTLQRRDLGNAIEAADDLLFWRELGLITEVGSFVSLQLAPLLQDLAWNNRVFGILYLNIFPVLPSLKPR